MFRSGIFLLFFLAQSVFASTNLDAFNKRFTIVKGDEGQTTYVKMNFVQNRFSLTPYIKQVVADIKDQLRRMSTKSGDQEIENFLIELESMSDIKDEQLAENIFTVRESLKNLDAIGDVDKFITPIVKSDVFANFQKGIQDALNKYSLAVIASTEDSRYFYKRNVTYAVLTKALDFAKKRFSSLPALNIASYILVQVHELILEQRTFHQNMLLHYLETVNESELGISKIDADKIYSSIYESRISYLNIFESNRAVETWDRYGLNIFYQSLRAANNKLRRSTYRGNPSVKRYNYAFFEVDEAGDRVVKNLFDKNHTFSSKMSIAYNYNKPQSVQRFRTLLSLGQLGLGFLPIPGWLKGQVENFLKSFYVNQRLTEGALVGFFEMNQNNEMAQKIVIQSRNPYILF